MVTRFAPSPTGWLHLGHAYSAILAWERAQEVDGEFLLRFEDIDFTRVRDEFYQGIKDDLKWLGIKWNEEPLRQLDRAEHYRAALKKLESQEILYPCFCTRRDLAEAVGAPQQGDETVKYSGRCRELSDDEVAERLASKQPFSWRLNIARAAGKVGDLTFHDRIQGTISVKPDMVGDPVLARKDIGTSYHLSVVVDDAAQGVSEVIRGRDLLESTHLHRVLQSLLNLPEPCYWHHPLVVNEDGRRLAKRENSLAIKTLRERGLSAAEVVAMARSQVEKLPIQ